MVPVSGAAVATKGRRAAKAATSEIVPFFCSEHLGLSVNHTLLLAVTLANVRVPKIGQAIPGGWGLRSVNLQAPADRHRCPLKEFKAISRYL
jgi:hypothetical protein